MADSHEHGPNIVVPSFFLRSKPGFKGDQGHNGPGRCWGAIRSWIEIWRRRRRVQGLVQSAEWFRKAPEQNHPLAQLDPGLTHAKGKE